MRTLFLTLESAIQDVRYGARQLWQSPWFTIVGVVSLAVGLGAGVALFTFMNALLFRPLPGRDTGNIQAIFTSGSRGQWYGSSSFADFQSFVGSAPEIFAGACATTNVTANIASGGSPRAVPGALVNGGCLDALKIRPHLGRLLQPADDSQAGDSPGIVVSKALWTRAFDAAPDIVGRGAFLNGVPVVVVGVAEAGFAGLSLDSGADFWAPPPLAPVLFSARTLTARDERRFRIYARLRDGVTASQAASRLSVVAGQLRAADPDAWTDNSGAARRITVVAELESRFASAPGAAAGISSATLGAIGVIVLMACVNLATMIVARGAGRTRELNIRVALGASRVRLLRQLATESLLISMGGTIAGVLLVSTGLRLFDAMRPAELPTFNAALDWRVTVFSLAVAILTPILFGVVPGMHALRLAIAEGLKSRPVFVRRRYLRLGPREILLFVQVVVSFALLVMAALFMRSLAITSADPAASQASVAVVPIDLTGAAQSDADRRATTDRLLEAASRVPDVEAPTAAALVPMTGSFLGVAAGIEDRADARRPGVDANIVTPGYVELAGIARRAGRTFEARDHDRAPLVVIVSESLARRWWGAAPAVGRTVRLDRGPADVIGVVADVPYRSLSDPIQPVLYLPAAQLPPHRLVLHARVKTGSRGIADLDRALRAVDPRVFVGAAMPFGDYLDQARMPARVAQGIGTVAGLLQLGLALMATWGLVAYAVERRTTEIAVRRALGATEGNILHLVMRASLWLVAVGAPLGTLAGIVGANVLHASFTELKPMDPAVAAPAACGLLAVVAVAAWLPARRAASIDPASALKRV